MRKEIGKSLRSRFAKRMKINYSKFKPYKNSAYRGDRVFLWHQSDHVYMFLILAIHQSFDLFNVMIGWSEVEQIPYARTKTKEKVRERLFDLNCACSDKIKPQTEFRLDPGDFSENRIKPWEKRGLSPEEYQRQMNAGQIPDDVLTADWDEYYRKDPVEDCIKRIDPCLDNAMKWLSMYGMPYLYEEVFKHTGIRIS